MDRPKCDKMETLGKESTYILNEDWMDQNKAIEWSTNASLWLSPEYQKSCLRSQIPGGKWPAKSKRSQGRHDQQAKGVRNQFSSDSN